MDPIHPIEPGPRSLSPAARLAVERLERISRERDRPSRERHKGKRASSPRKPERQSRGEDGAGPHIDVRA